MDTMTLYRNQINKFQLLNAEQEKALAVKALAGDEQARETLINSNLKLVMGVARRFQNRGLSFEDLTMEGNIGLLTAVAKFDPTRGFRFSTYATPWIEQAVRRGLANTGQTIRIPVHVSEAIGKLCHTRDRLFAKLGYDPSHAELAEASGLTEAKVDSLVIASHGASSLDNTTGEGRDMTFADLLHSQVQAPDEGAFENIQHDTIASLFKKLKDDKEVMVLRLRHGFGENDPHTLDEIGQKLGLTRERIRQIEANALEHLREAMAA